MATNRVVIDANGVKPIRVRLKVEINPAIYFSLLLVIYVISTNICSYIHTELSLLNLINVK